MKHYTTIEQSKKLLELGLNPETADMWYDVTNHIRIDKRQNTYQFSWMPCWSSGALLEMMPDEIKVNGTNCNLYIAKDFISYEGLDRYDTSTTIQPMVFYDKPFIELLFEAICWLLENNYIKTEK